MRRTTFVDGLLCIADTFVEHQSLTVAGEYIESISATNSSHGNADDVIDLAGMLVVPGFVDLQVNGGGGVLFNDDPSVESIKCMSDAHVQFGTTGFLPTLISDTREKMVAAIDAVAKAIESGIPGVLGIHIEGPFLNPQKRGIHDASVFRQLTADDIEILSTANCGTVLLTLAPEMIDSHQLVTLADRGVKVWGGHSNATYDQTNEAIRSGLSGFTHLYNAMSQMESRKPGMVGAALASENSYVGLIADGWHVHPAVLKVTLRAKAPGTVVLVTDAMPVVGTHNDAFELLGQTISTTNGRCINSEGFLAGSCLSMINAVTNATRYLDIDFADAVALASRNPCTALGIDSKVGQLAAGKLANFVVLDQLFAVQQTWINGYKVFDRV